MKLITPIFLTLLFISCSSSTEDTNKKEPPYIAKDFSFLEGRWKVNMTRNYRQGFKSSGTGIAVCSVNEDKTEYSYSNDVFLTIDGNPNNSLIWKGITTHTLNKETNEWAMEFRNQTSYGGTVDERIVEGGKLHNGAIRYSGTKGSFSEDGSYTEIYNGTSSFYEAQKIKHVIKYHNISKNRFEVTESLYYEDGTIISDYERMVFIKQ